MEFPKARLLVFAKAPVPERVKTRLAAKYGQRGAANLYKAMVRRTLATFSEACLCPIEIWCGPDTKHGFFTACRRDYDVRLRRQSSGDLGTRMHQALVKILAAHPYAVLIGGDCATLGADDVRFALKALEQGHDAVLGPAEDGGYVLIGLRDPQPALFRDMSWGGVGVLAATRRRLASLELEWAELPMRWDVDRPSDVRRLRRERGVDLKP